MAERPKLLLIIDRKWSSKSSASETCYDMVGKPVVVRATRRWGDSEHPNVQRVREQNALTTEGVRLEVAHCYCGSGIDIDSV